ncbi:hypothetical protein MTR67_042867 [Solanum verrucosum]|uniref:Uncharacterized protein n=1 Tax=Solanum verrucosum TaxID=315347 RepID=A0AAF0UNM3_SOLVR|nr:hypothetical protein MTR67_042867 [Solanum verrucosum]
MGITHSYELGIAQT